MMSALVIGCMAPDFEYFLRFSPEGPFGHTLPGVFILDLPLGLIALWLYHSYAKEPLYAWLPESMQRRIEPGPASPPVKNLSQFALAVASILVGVATHIFWDSFTHTRFWPYHHWRFLHRTLELPIYGSIKYIRVIQQVSTVAGAVVLLIWLRHWFRTAAPDHACMPRYEREKRRAALVIVCIVALAGACVRAFLILVIARALNLGTVKDAFESAVITGIDFFWLAVIVYGAWRSRKKEEKVEA